MENHLEQIQFYGPVKTIKTSQGFLKERFGEFRKVEERFYLKEYHYFNFKGQLIEIKEYENNGHIKKHSRFKYDSIDNLIEKTVSSHLWKKINYKYDNLGNLIESLVYERNGKFLSGKRIFGSKGKLIEEINFGSDQEISKKVFEYNQDDQLIKMKGNRYDNSGRKIKWNTWYLSIGERYEYIYDETGDVIEMREYTNCEKDSSGSIENENFLSTIIKYDPEGKELERVQYNMEGKTEYKCQTVYDCHRNPENVLRNNRYEEYEYEYDLYGNWIKRKKIQGNGFPPMLEEREIIYYEDTLTI